MSDKKFGHINGSSYDYYTADVVNATDYYPFGMVEPGRSYSAVSGYRFGFNGKENDNEVKGEGNEQDYGMRVYDTRLGKFLSVDPLTKKYPELTPYQFSGNTPIQATDLDGAETYLQRVGSATKRKAELALDNYNRTQNITYILQHAAMQRTSGGGATVSQLDMSYDAVQRRQELQEQYQYAKNMSGATMDTWAGGVAYQGLTTAKSYVQGTMQHAYGVFQGIKEGDYGSAAKNAGFLALDVSPFIAIKGSSVLSSSTAEETFLYRFDTRSPEEIIKAGGFKAYGTNEDLFWHAEGTTINNKTSAYVATSSDLKALEKAVGNQKGYIYRIKMQPTGKNVNSILGTKSPHPEEMEVAVPKEIKLTDITGYKPHNK